MAQQKEPQGFYGYKHKEPKSDVLEFDHRTEYTYIYDL